MGYQVHCSAWCVVACSMVHNVQHYYGVDLHAQDVLAWKKPLEDELHSLGVAIITISLLLLLLFIVLVSIIIANIIIYSAV